MPFKSESQRKFLYANHPKIAKEFEKMTPKGIKLPQKAPKKPKGVIHGIPGIKAK